MVNEREILYGKIKAQMKVCLKSFDKSMYYLTMSQLYMKDSAQEKEWLTKRLMAEARCQSNDERLNELVTKYHNSEIIIIKQHEQVRSN